MHVLTDEHVKESQERYLQHFRLYFRPSEVVVNHSYIIMNIPDRLPEGDYTSSKVYNEIYGGEPLPNKCLPHVFTQEEIASIIKLCEADLTEYIQTGRTSSILFTAIDEMFDFLNLLSKPENHIRVPSGQYVKKHVNVRPVHDMTNEMAQEIGKLPPYHAYVKLIDNNQNEQVVRTHRIKTNPLPEITNTHMEAQAIANGHTLGKDRDAIEEETRERQNRWRPGSGEAPQTHRRRE
jgi:hypothetical protein